MLRSFHQGTLSPSIRWPLPASRWTSTASPSPTDPEKLHDAVPRAPSPEDFLPRSSSHPMPASRGQIAWAVNRLSMPHPPWNPVLFRKSRPDRRTRPEASRSTPRIPETRSSRQLLSRSRRTSRASNSSRRQSSPSMRHDCDDLQTSRGLTRPSGPFLPSEPSALAIDDGGAPDDVPATIPP